ncbi:MAG TPA: SGNH/GDSL hydrolase family protein [Acidimicrobiales bacterium]
MLLALGAAALSSLQLVPVATAAPSANAGPKSMVALGDSFASGPLVPVQYEQAWGCLRSSNNYAHQVARELVLELTDVTCSGASTKHMWETHGVSPEQEFAEYGGEWGYTGHPGNPPQLDALRENTDIVTLQIGGNDIGFGGLATTCGEGAIRGPGCREAVAAERPFERIAATAPKIQAVLDEIHRRSPKAAIYVLGYSGIFKIGSVARCDAMGVGEEDAQYLRSIQEALNAMIQSVADAGGYGYSDATTYVDVYGPSAGHTACDLPAIRWVEPIVPVNAAAPVHPNLGGMTAVKDILLDAVWPSGLPRRGALPGLPAPPDAPISV